ncbi:hypothetical protein PHYSODRAFT_259149 [Phytophthora sojae]|uniref:Retrotransposon gag domain-containing protein n=1 Tax=Phytophthora sojae (strain P6497) TaxID=1094619 RepID=G4ZTU2_PHYSP|nr:hypothetical protein PHYSODRAFT_259149 [Phytophthora sojae]EGZ13216.1 hypothetical protein PHYSODRAFT_259149 [Phytophthora sojae]|eukprot:XP_009530645.1 hypothetical protein PHYSODRAFT_259149 [Phytophthora sojae]
MTTDATADEARTVQFDEEDAQDQESEEDVEDEYEEKAELLGEVDELLLQVGRIGTPRPVVRNLATELGNDTDDEDQAAAQGERPPLIPRATRNADTPSANKVLGRLGEEMRAQSEWMMMFAPVVMAQARWPVLGPELTQPVNSTDINQLVEDTVQLLKAMGFRCTSRPNSLLLGDWDPSRASREILKWKRRLRVSFGLERGTVGIRQTIAKRVADTPKTVEDPSRIPLPKTPERKRAEVFRSTEGTPYFEDSHMKTPTRGKQPSGRYAELFDAADAAELSDSDDGREYLNSAEKSVKDVIKHLSFDDAESDRTQYLEVRTHASLDKIPMFEGKRYRPDDSLQWLKRFIYEMKGTRLAQDLWYEPFSLKLERGAKCWYRQLPKKTQRKRSLLSEAFADYYCSQFDQSARARYYSAQRKDNELVCDFLVRLNGYAKSAEIQYEAGGADAVDHVEHFLLHCGDDDIMDLLYPQQLTDIKKVEKIINQKVLGERRTKQRDRLIGSRSRDAKRTDSPRHSEARRSEPRRDDRRDDRRERRRDDRRDDRRSRRDDGRDRRLATALLEDDPYELAERRQSNRRSNLYDSDCDQSDGSQPSYFDSAVDSEDDYIDTGFTSDRDCRSGDRENSAGTPRSDHRRGQPSSADRASRGYDRRDQTGRRSDSRERHLVLPAVFCKQLHDVGQCELFQRYEKLAAFVKSNIDKSKLPEDLQDLYTPSDLNSAARQH